MQVLIIKGVCKLAQSTCWAVLTVVFRLRFDQVFERLGLHEGAYCTHSKGIKALLWTASFISVFSLSLSCREAFSAPLAASAWTLHVDEFESTCLETAYKYIYAAPATTGISHR